MTKAKSGDLEGTHAAPGAGGSAGAELDQADPARPQTQGELAILPDDDDAATDALLPMRNTPPPPRGRGRPKGARNTRTDLVARYLVARYGDPLEADVAIGTMSPRELASELRAIASDCGLKLGMSVGDIVKWQRECRASSVPYIHAKRATADDMGDPVTPVFMFGTVEQAQDGKDGRSIEDFEDYQEVSESDPQKSDGEKSDESPSD